MNLCTSTFAYVYSIGLYKRIVNAVTQSIRIANADGQDKVVSFFHPKNSHNFQSEIPNNLQT